MSLRLSALALLMVAVTGCQTARFYTQAATGEWEILSKRRPITDVLKSPDTPPRLQRQLTLVRELRAFAQDQLQLPAQGEFVDYADLRRPYVVWNVQAAPAFSLKAKTWWYPFVGRLEYQGYFKKDLATDYARRLREEGLDVFAGGVTAYSTLGWFDDPVLNTFINEPEGELADLIFHELAHRRLFIPGDTDFNEAFASSVAREGVRRWFAHKKNPRALAGYLENRRAEDEVIDLVLAARKRLETLYESADFTGPETLAARKSAIIGQLRAQFRAFKANHPDYHDYDDWMAAPVNNAQINTIDTYYHLMPGFEARLHELRGDLGAFYKDVAAMRRIKKDERRDLLADALARSTKPGVLPDEPENRRVQQSAQTEDQPERPLASLVPKEKLADPPADESADEVHQ